MAWDWVIGVGYGTGVTVAASNALFIVLTNLPDVAGAGTGEFGYEEDTWRSLYLERIVGDINFQWVGEASPNQLAWRIMPLPADYDAPGVLYPYSPLDIINGTEDANLRWWGERRYVCDVGTGSAGPALVDHPYWTEVDLHPKSWVGSKYNVWPVLVVQNPSSTTDLRLTHHLRLLMGGS